MALPTNLGTGTVVATVINPDSTGSPLVGPGPTFTPSYAVPALDVGATTPVMVTKKTIQSTFNASGQLKALDGTSALVLLANQDPDLNPPDWNWIVDWTGVSGFSGVAPYPIDVPQGTTVNLATVMPVGASNGTLIIQGPPGAPGPAVSTAGATTGQVYTYNGTSPVWSNPTGGGGGAGTVTSVNSVTPVSGNVALTKADFPGDLDNVDNTHDNAKAVLSATQWATSRTVTLTGPVTGSTSINGSANVTIATSLSGGATGLAVLAAPDQATLWTAIGTVPVNKLPADAIGHAFKPANLAARLALAAKQGDVAVQTDTGIAYSLATTDPTVDANWTALTATASTTVKGLTRLATTTEANTGTDATIAVTPAGLASTFNSMLALQGVPVMVQWSGVSWGSYNTDPLRVRIFLSQNDINATTPTGYNSNDLWFGAVSL